MGIVSIVIACIALILSAAIFIRDNRRYHISLEIRLPALFVESNNDNQSLVLFRLIFVNHSLCGRTVVRTLITLPNNIIEIPIAWVHDKDFKNVTARLPNLVKINPLPIQEVFHDALDIPPHQSQSKWVGYLLKLPQKQDNPFEEQEIWITFVALDVNDKFLAGVRIPLTLSELRTLGAHQVIHMQAFNKIKKST